MLACGNVCIVLQLTPAFVPRSSRTCEMLVTDRLLIKMHMKERKQQTTSLGKTQRGVQTDDRNA